METYANHKSNTARTYEDLRDAIIDAKYPPGEKLRIEQLCKVLDASSGAVREALSRLTAEGLVLAEPQRGFAIAPISRRDLEDLTDVRVEIECRCLAESIANGDIAWEGRVLSLQHQLRSLQQGPYAPGSPETQLWHRLHEAFHRELTSACTNTWWQRLREQLYLQSERYRRLSGPYEGTRRNISAEHDAIANAAIARDSETASRLMAEHLRMTTEILLKSAIPSTDSPPKKR
ncbi:GntR family transcriptional regulator protein (plasmid) [Rhizobium etli 8C-3]|uniref:GntR family transcriptional regulator protein n=1 Tax=Rhizobium etli 8C-3 TaxID=538025 RepID=A0A1L5PAF0_RHIET|nr:MULTISPECIES: GntR family transcriptional regulator [Rhizobium/Agrobacterium group]APO77063.1 GntR family transcriptional regulator protein [Rhizobium etli 8C-3]